MKDRLERFISSYDGFSKQSKIDVVLGFAYFLTYSEGLEEFTAEDITQCFKEVKIRLDPNVSQHLHNYCDQLKTAHSVFFIESDTRYSLSRQGQKHFEELFGEFEQQPTFVASTENDLSDLANHINNPDEMRFREETILCYQAGAYRASIVMIWEFAIDHLRKYILSNKLSEYNKAYAASTDGQIKAAYKKTGDVKDADGFVELDESAFIALCKSANVVEKVTKKVLDGGLNTRNLAAHANTVEITSEDAIALIRKLVKEIKKYPL